MKVSGISEEEKRQGAELIEFERLVDKDNSYVSERKAQLYVCLAHDWFMMEMEEEGERLIYKALDVCAGYFGEPMIQHQLENPNFATVIKNLTGELRKLLIDTLRSK